MCEREYTGCANCGAPVDEMSYWADEQRREYFHLDEDGDPSDCYDASEAETYDSGYSCARCDSDNTSVDTECVPDDCDCRECDPETAVIEPEEGEAIVLLRRTNHNERPELCDDTPAEIVQLFSDRAITVVPVRADRAAELWEEDFIPRDHAEVDLHTCVPDHLKPEEAAA